MAGQQNNHRETGNGEKHKQFQAHPCSLGGRREAEDAITASQFQLQD
jgi:hypothetical protein